MDSTTTANKGVGRKLPKPNNLIKIPTSINTGFFKWWCVFLRPLVKLSDRELEVVSCFLKQRWLLSKDISNPAILDSQLMANETKEKIVAECNMSLPHFYVVMNSLKKNGVIINGRLNPRLIPNIREDDNGVFQLLILFKDEDAHAA